MSSESFLDRVVALLTSLRLTVVCLVLAMLIVFLGTMAQDSLGLYLSQEKFFRSFFVPAPAMAAALKKTLEMAHIYLAPTTAMDVWYGSRLPVFPGGYLVGGVLLMNLVASHYKRFKFSRDKAGIWLVHFGLILVLLGQLMTDLLARETSLHLREGETKNYSESSRHVELALLDTTAPDLDKVVAIPQNLLAGRKEIRTAELPFVVRVKEFIPNASVEERKPDATTPPPANQGVGQRAVVKSLPRVTEMDSRDAPAAVVELATPAGLSLGTWLVSEYIKGAQAFTYEGHNYSMEMRLQRFYKPFSLQLLDFRHDIYPGTDIPKNFSSRVLLQRPDTAENREVLIKMNSPLRYAGETFYQSGYDPDNHGTTLQVVHNPSWLTPYFSCILVGLGLLVQFATHLLGFSMKRKPAPASQPATRTSVQPATHTAR